MSKAEVSNRSGRESTPWRIRRLRHCIQAARTPSPWRHRSAPPAQPSLGVGQCSWICLPDWLWCPSKLPRQLIGRTAVLLRDSAYRRPVELGPYPLEALARDRSAADAEQHHRLSRDALAPAATPLAAAARRYAQLFCGFAEGECAPGQASGSLDPARRAREIKGAAYYLGAAHAGICEIPPWAWRSEEAGHSHALVILTAEGRAIEPDNPAHAWLQGAQGEIARLRAMEIAVCIAGQIRAMGHPAQAHCAGRSRVHLEALAVLAGVARRKGERLASPFLGEAFALAAVTSSYALAIDLPLAAGAKVHPLRHWWGLNGAVSGRERRRCAKRRSDLSRYPMELVRRVEKPTTLILEDEVPRVPLRANFFVRARHGDLGPKAQREVARFAYKHPLTEGMMPVLRSMVPHQDGPLAATPGIFGDPEANTRALKSLSYHLGADLTGVCEIPDYAWYSHGANGDPIAKRHKYALVMLIDQGYDTMEGASGDDWISGCQSMRSYLRGAEIAGVMAEFLRSQGVSARPQTNADSELLHIPLILLAGLGELSRIGELALNPFVGPRFKSVVLTTDLPLMPDKPIDFGLQYFCSRCLKCARECPVNAIPFGGKVMFNGYEIWKPDVERCTSYRIANQKGSACGRCMKTCPLNKVATADGSLLHRVGTWLGIRAFWLKPLLVPLAVWLDDWLRFGLRNPIKRWWQDLEMVDGVAVKPAGVNERDLDLGADRSGRKSPVGYYHAADMPLPKRAEAMPVCHRAAVDRAKLIETVDAAQARRARGGARPGHYIPGTWRR